MSVDFSGGQFDNREVAGFQPDIGVLQEYPAFRCDERLVQPGAGVVLRKNPVRGIQGPDEIGKWHGVPCVQFGRPISGGLYQH